MLTRRANLTLSLIVAILGSIPFLLNVSIDSYLGYILSIVSEIAHHTNLFKDNTVDVSTADGGASLNLNLM
jgi:hypothetical protein